MYVMVLYSTLYHMYLPTTALLLPQHAQHRGYDLPLIDTAGPSSSAPPILRDPLSQHVHTSVSNTNDRNGGATEGPKNKSPRPLPLPKAYIML